MGLCTVNSINFARLEDAPIARESDALLYVEKLSFIDSP